MCRPNLTLTQRLVKRVLAPFARPFTSMPGQSFAGEPKPLSRDQLLLKDRLRLHIEKSPFKSVNVVPSILSELSSAKITSRLNSLLQGSLFRRKLSSLLA